MYHYKDIYIKTLCCSSYSKGCTVSAFSLNSFYEKGK